MISSPRPTPVQSLSASLTPKKASKLPVLLLILGAILCVGMALFGMIEGRRTERIIIAARAIPNGTQITADDLAAIERPIYGQPEQLAGINDPSLVIGRYATCDITQDDMLKVAIVTDVAPDQPVFPSGKKLQKNMVVLPFSTTTIGPLHVNDFVNIGFNDEHGDPQVCAQANAAAAGQSMSTSADTQASRAFACRMMERVSVLYVDDEKQTAYLEVTPYQAQAVWAVQAAGLQLWGERYGASSAALQTLDRVAPIQFDASKLTSAAPQDGNNAIPGKSAIPGQPQTDAAPEATSAPDTATK